MLIHVISYDVAIQTTELEFDSILLEFLDFTNTRFLKLRLNFVLSQEADMSCNLVSIQEQLCVGDLHCS